MTVRVAVAALLLACVASWAAAQDTKLPAGARKWTDATGRYTIQAEFAGLKEGMVQLKKADGGTMSVALEKLSEEDQKLVQSLVGKPGQAGSQELKHDDGQQANRESIAGAGPAVRFESPAGSWMVTSIRIFASRYGYPQPPKENVSVWICDEQGKVLTEQKVPYKVFLRGEAKWVTVRLRSVPLPEKFLVAFNFNAEKTKGVYVGYDAQSSGDSLVGLPGRQFKPFERGDWLIRATIEPAKGEPAKMGAEKPDTKESPAK